jgi:hypothetical protein
MAMRIRSNKMAVIMTMALTTILSILMTSSACAQGSIFGFVKNSDSSTPANGEMSFFGYLDDTDEEIKIETSIGAGYDADSGAWYDDFQNYLTEAAGNPYDYHFYNLINGEGFILSKPIPNNSFQQEDIALAPVTWPTIPTGLSGQAISASMVLIHWNAGLDLTYHIYRRTAPSNGSFFRIDDPIGSLTNPGVADSFFVDTTVDGISDYHYLIIAEDAGGNLSPHSDVITVSSSISEAPEIVSIIPDSGSEVGGTAVTISGIGFDPAGAMATIDGAPLTSVTVESPFEITGITPTGTVGPADVVVMNAASGLASAALTGGFVYLFNNPPVVADIPDQAILGDGPFAAISLDDYIDDLDHPDSLITLGYSGASDLSVDITNRVATVTIANPDWPGTETIVFRATDPGGKFDENSVTFVQAKITAASLDLGNVPVNFPDSIMFTIGTPAGLTVVSPQIIPSEASVVIRRDDGSAVDDDIPPDSVIDYWAVWTPPDTFNAPGIVTITSTSVDDDEQLNLSGKAVSMGFIPALANYDYGDVNAVDRRAADTVRINVDVIGNIGGTIVDIIPNGLTDDFNVITPLAGDSLQSGSAIEFVIVSHPQSTGLTANDVWIGYSIDLGDTTVADSVSLMGLSATGVEPDCNIAQDTIDFFARRIGTTHTLPFTLSNNSTVYEIIDSIYYDAYTNIFQIDPALNKPLYIAPGDTEITIYFQPQAEIAYAANMIIVDSLFGDCNPPAVRGIGVPAEIHWEPDTPVSMGLVDLCDSSTTLDYQISNKIVGFDLIVDDIHVDSSTWFHFFPDPSTIIGSTFSPSAPIEFDSISFIPLGFVPLSSFKMMLAYHVDTVGAPADTLVFDLVNQTGSCAGILDQPPPLFFGSSSVGQTAIDTITLKNTGSCDLTIDSLTIDIADFLHQDVNTPLTIRPNQWYKLEVRFTPSSVGLQEGQLTVHHNGYINPIDPDLDCPLKSQTIGNLAGMGTDTICRPLLTMLFPITAVRSWIYLFLISVLEWNR